MHKCFSKITVTYLTGGTVIYTDATIEEKQIFAYFDVVGIDEDGKQSFTEFNYDEVKEIKLEV